MDLGQHFWKEVLHTYKPDERTHLFNFHVGVHLPEYRILGGINYLVFSLPIFFYNVRNTRLPSYPIPNYLGNGKNP